MIGTTIDRACAIMGPERVRKPEDVERRMGTLYTPRQREHLQRGVPFLEKTLERCREESYVLFPGQMSRLPEVMRALGHFVHGQWWIEYPFPPVENRWYLMLEGSLPGSNLRNWEAQLALLDPDQAVPSVPAVVFGHHLFDEEPRIPIVKAPARCRGGRFAVRPSPEGLGIHDGGLGTGLPGVMVEWKPIGSPIWM